MGFRFLRRHSILAGAALLLCAVILTMVFGGGGDRQEAVPFLTPLSSSPSSSPAVSSAAGSSSVSAESGTSSPAGDSSGSSPAVSASEVTSGAASSSSESAVEASASVDTQEEMRGVWVPFMSLDMSAEDSRGEALFREKFSAIVSGAKQYGMNALIVHVRPFGDALYESDHVPWSHIVSGTQGEDPGYDPLAIMVELAHEQGLELHAWMNPLRIQMNDTPSVLSEDNPWNLWQGDEEKAGWVVQSGAGKYYNPAYPEVRAEIAACAEEIASRYDVDGIQFDDYFYPTQDASFDEAAYTAYTQEVSGSGEPLSLADWRIANINALISEVYRRIKAVNPEIQFGIAPQGNLQNDWNMGADVATWCKTSGYLDYICPQLYVNFENPTLPFGPAAQTWKNLVVNPDIKLYLGLAVYKAGSDADDGTWKTADDILARQVSLGRTVECDGFLFYSWDYLIADQTKAEVANVMKVLEQESP